MANEIEVVIKSKDQSSEGFKKSKKAADDYGSGLERAGEKADKGEQKILGLKDTVDGVATVMQGPGKAGTTAYIQGWADIASGIANFAVPVAQAATNIAKTAFQSGLAGAKMKIASGAAKVWAAMQWLLNTAMSANPIAIVVIAVAALVAGFIIAYKKSETFRNFVNKLWGVLKEGGKAAISAVLTGIDKFLGGLEMILKAMGKLPGPLGAPFRKAADAIEGARRKVRALRDEINKTPSKKNITVNVTIKGRTIGFTAGSAANFRAVEESQRRASGGIVGAQGGGPRSRLTMVGEHGAELLDLPPGSRVRSNPDTERMLAGSGGGRFVLEINSGGSKLDDAIVEIIRKAVRAKSGGNVQAALGRA